MKEFKHRAPNAEADSQAVQVRATTCGSNCQQHPLQQQQQQSSVATAAACLRMC
jgi:hypothetical protein